MQVNIITCIMKKSLLFLLGLLFAWPLSSYAGAAPLPASHSPQLAAHTKKLPVKLQKHLQKLERKAEKGLAGKMGLALVFIGLGFTLAALLLVPVEPVLAGVVAGGGLLLAIIGVIVTIITR